MASRENHPESLQFVPCSFGSYLINEIIVVLDTSSGRLTDNQKQIETISGVVAALAVKPTRTGRSMITFTLSGKNCKAFDKVASTVQGLTGEQVELEVTRGSYMGKDEYCLTCVHGANSSTVGDTSRTNVTIAPTPGMERWHTRHGERASFRKLVVDYGDPELIAKFDALPWPEAPKEQMHQFLKAWSARPNKRKTQMQDYARSLGYSEDEIKQADKEFSKAGKSENEIIDHLQLNRSTEEVAKMQCERNKLSNQRIPDVSQCPTP